MKLLDLFSGIGGFSLGLERAGFQTVAFCEIDPYCRRVLTKHWPEVPIYEDIRGLTAGQLAADGVAVDCISGGFPCQDISIAGGRAGIEGEKSGLWREFARLIGEIRPRYVVVENSPALLFDGLGRILGDLAEIGFDAEWHAISAAHVGAPHQRDRIWVVAYSDTLHGQTGLGLLADYEAEIRAAEDRNRASIWLAAPPVPVGVGDGPAAWLDRRERTEGIGNAVVPQIPELIGRAIMAAQ